MKSAVGARTEKVELANLALRRLPACFDRLFAPLPESSGALHSRMDRRLRFGAFALKFALHSQCEINNTSSNVNYTIEARDNARALSHLF